MRSRRADVEAVLSPEPRARAARLDGRRSRRLAAPAPSRPQPPDRQSRRCAQAIAALMARSKREIPHYYLPTEID